MSQRDRPIGGFFELELSREMCGGYHPKAVALSTGRACIALLLKEIQPKKFYLPYYCCDALFEPFDNLNIDYEFYGIDENFSLTNLPDLEENEYILYVNYFGIKTDEVNKLITKYKQNIIIDDTHNFFHRGYDGIWSFTSARKYFAVPDGAYLYSPNNIEDDFDRFTAISIDHNVQRLIGNHSTAYKKYVEYEKTLTSDIYGISLYSEIILENVDYNEVIKRRRSNFNFYKTLLDRYNKLETTIQDSTVPFCYPFLTDRSMDKAIFHQNDYFIPTFWPDVAARGQNAFDIDVRISRNLIPLPIDHRYTAAELKPLAHFLIKEMLANEK